VFCNCHNNHIDEYEDFIWNINQNSAIRINFVLYRPSTINHHIYVDKPGLVPMIVVMSPPQQSIEIVWSLSLAHFNNPKCFYMTSLSSSHARQSWGARCGVPN
jgi:hypothetical protein